MILVLIEKLKEKDMFRYTRIVSKKKDRIIEYTALDTNQIETFRTHPSILIEYLESEND